MATCPPGPVPPPGWQLWRTPALPDELGTWANSLLNGIGRVEYGYTWERPWPLLDRQVLAIKQHHTYTTRGGRLVTGICIPGITLYWRQADAPPSTLPSDPPSMPGRDDVAMFDEGAGTDWPVVAVSAGAIVTVCILFALAIRHGGKPPPKKLSASKRVRR